MDQVNWFIIPISALIPLVLGYVWYHPSVMGTRLANATGTPIADISPPKSIGRIALIYLFSLLLSYIITAISVHQFAIFQLFFMEPSLAEAGSEFSTFTAEFLEKYGNRHRSFSHGVIHGAEVAIYCSLSFIGTSALFMGKPFKSTLVHIGFWFICCSLIGGLNCTFF